jgi:hypothetical protein
MSTQPEESSTPPTESSAPGTSPLASDAADAGGAPDVSVAAASTSPPARPPAAVRRDDEGMFAAYLEEKRRRAWPWLLLVAALLVGVVLSIRTAPRAIYQVSTRRGVMTLSSGMHAAQIERRLGHPIASEQVGGLDCRRYGTPQFDQKFWVYSICYDGDALVSLKAARMEAKRIQNIPRLAPPAP